MSSEQRQSGPGNPGERLRDAATRLTRLYEREAYRVYNVALRIACDPAAAERATEGAFVEQARRADELLAAPEGAVPTTLVPATIRAALAAAPRRPSCASDDAEAKAMLEAAAKLGPPERAALALNTVTGAGAAEVAAALGVQPERAAQLLESSRAAVAERLQARPGTLEERLAAWPWADPPQSLWESVYRASHGELERWARGAQPAAPSVSRKGAKRRGQKTQSTRRRRWALRAGIVSALVAAIAAVALTRSADDPQEAASATTFAGEPATPVETPTDESTPPEGSDSSGDAEKPYEALTPEELDELRLQELADLERYARRQADESLSAEQRAAAQAQAEQLIAAAQDREQGGSGGGGGGASGGSGGGSGGGGSGGGNQAKPPQQTGGGAGGGDDTPTDSGGSSGNTGGNDGGGSGGGKNDGGGGGKNDGGDGGKNGGGGKNDGDGQSLDECIRDTSTGQYICPEQDRQGASEDVE